MKTSLMRDVKLLESQYLSVSENRLKSNAKPYLLLQHISL
jgi:hypothetical protein